MQVIMLCLNCHEMKLVVCVECSRACTFQHLFYNKQICISVDNLQQFGLKVYCIDAGLLTVPVCVRTAVWYLCIHPSKLAC